MTNLNQQKGGKGIIALMLFLLGVILIVGLGPGAVVTGKIALCLSHTSTAPVPPTLSLSMF